MKYLISIFIMTLMATTSCFSQSYNYPVQSDASGKINGWNTYKQANDIASGAELIAVSNNVITELHSVSNGITTELHSVSNYFEVRLDNTAQNYSVVSNKAMNSVQDLDAGDDMRIASTEKLSLHSDKALSIQSEEVIHIFSANGVQMLDLQADSLIITNNPTATNEVGNRGYNDTRYLNQAPNYSVVSNKAMSAFQDDGRYLLQTSTNAVIAEAVKQAEGAASLSTVVLLTGEKTPAQNGSEFRTAMTTANVAGKQTLILVGDGDYLFTSDWNPTIVSNAIITIVAVHRNPVTRALSQGCEPTGFIPKARFYGTTKYKFYMSGVCSYKGIFFDNLNVYFNYSATDVADIEDLVMTKESFGSHCEKMTMKRVCQKEEDCLSSFYIFLSGNYKNIYSESSLCGINQSLIKSTFTGCSSGDYSFGGNDITDSTFKNCSSGDYSFGHNITNSTFESCSGRDYSFGGYNIIKSTFTGCSSGDYSFGSHDITDSTFTGCSGRDGSFGGHDITNSTFESCSGRDYSFGGHDITNSTFESCSGRDYSFGGYNIIKSTFTGCSSDDYSFGGHDITNSVFTDCKTGKKSFGAYVDNCVFTDCTAGEDSFGGKNDNFYYDSANDSVLGTPLGTFNNSFATNCVGGERSFGVKEIENSVFVRCQSANDSDDYVFCGYESFISNVFEKCVATGGKDLGHSFGGNEITDSTFTDCSSGDYCFGYNDIINSVFTGCSSRDYSFGYNITDSTFTDCSSGDYSFGQGNIINSTFKNCSSSGDDSFGQGDIIKSTFTDCSGRNYSFGYNITDSTFTDCSGRNDSFGQGNIINSTFKNCSSGDDSFGQGDIITPILIRCIGGANCFGNASTNYWCLGPSNSGLSASDVSDRGCIIK